MLYIYGKPAESYTKKQLIEFLTEANKMLENERRIYVNNLGFVAKLRN